MNTSATPFIPASHGLMDMAVILSKGGDYFEHGEMSECTRVILKNTGVYFFGGEIKLQRTEAVQR